MAALTTLLLGAAAKPMRLMIRIALLLPRIYLSLFWMPVRCAIRLFCFFLHHSRLLLLLFPHFPRLPRLQDRSRRHGFQQSAGNWRPGSWQSVGFLWTARAREKHDGLWQTGGLVWVADTRSDGEDAWRSSDASGLTNLGHPETNLEAWFASPDGSTTEPSSSPNASSSRIPRPCVVQPQGFKAAVRRKVFFTRSHGSKTMVLLPCESPPARRLVRKARSGRRGRQSRLEEVAMAASSRPVRWNIVLGGRPYTRASRIPVWSSRSSSS